MRHAPLADGGRQGTNGAHVDVELPPDRVLKTLLAITAALALLSVAGQVVLYALPDLPLKEEIATALDVNAERSIPTAFSIMCLLGAAGLLATVALAVRQRGHRDWGRWAALSALFVGLGADDYLAVHEQANQPVEAALGTTAGGLLHWGWVVPGIAFVAIVALLFGGLILRLPSSTRRWLLSAAVLFVAGALGMEMLGGVVADTYGTDHLAYELAATVEETLEMTGTAVFMTGLLRHLQWHLGGFSWRLRSAQEPELAA